MHITAKSLIILLVVLMISCKNQPNQNESPNAEPSEIVRKDTQETIAVKTTIDTNSIIEQLQGKWKEVAYPYRTAGFLNSTVKFVEEGTESKPKFEKFEVSEGCRYDNNNIRDLQSGDVILILPETRRCEKLNVSKDTLTLSGFSTNTNEEYNIIYSKSE